MMISERSALNQCFLLSDSAASATAGDEETRSGDEGQEEDEEEDEEETEEETEEEGPEEETDLKNTNNQNSKTTR